LIVLKKIENRNISTFDSIFQSNVTTGTLIKQNFHLLSNFIIHTWLIFEDERPQHIIRIYESEYYMNSGMTMCVYI